VLDGDQELIRKDNNKVVKISEIADENYNLAVDKINVSDNRLLFTIKEDREKIFSVTKIETYDTIGYRITDLAYTGDLISSIGESLTSILDKIKNMLGAFEYFYNLDGKFVFQAKKTYTNVSWNSIV
jgi:hypothetical protein